MRENENVRRQKTVTENIKYVFFYSALCIRKNIGARTSIKQII